MGGFTLVGPHNVFTSKADLNPCFCLGLHVSIDAATDQHLARSPTRVMDASLLTRLNSAGAHTGDQMAYTVHTRAAWEAQHKRPFVPPPMHVRPAEPTAFDNGGFNTFSAW